MFPPLLLQAPVPADSPRIIHDTIHTTQILHDTIHDTVSTMPTGFGTILPAIEIKNVGSLIDKFWEMGVQYAPRLIVGIAVLYLGFKLVNRLIRWIESVMKRNNFDKDLAPFIATLVSVVFKVLLFLSATDIIGLPTTSFVAILATAGLAVGLALQGSLSNLAGGILILIFKPFKTGDLIRTQDYVGFIKEIQILNTILVTNQNYRIIIPNSLITTGVIENLTGAGVIRMDLLYTLPYAENLDKIYDAIQKVIAMCPYAVIDEKRQHQIQLRTFSGGSVEIAACIWCKAEHYWDIQWYINDQMKRAFDEIGINIPFTRRDVFLKSVSERP